MERLCDFFSICCSVFLNRTYLTCIVSFLRWQVAPRDEDDDDYEEDYGSDEVSFRLICGLIDVIFVLSWSSEFEMLMLFQFSKTTATVIFCVSWVSFYILAILCNTFVYLLIWDLGVTVQIKCIVVAEFEMEWASLLSWSEHKISASAFFVNQDDDMENDPLEPPNSNKNIDDPDAVKEVLQ